MKTLFSIFLATSLPLTSSMLEDNRTFTSVFVDRHHDVHATNRQGKDFLLTRSKDAYDVKISPNGKTVTWRKMTGHRLFKANGSEISIFHDGIVKSLKCEPKIRDYWFWKGGKKIAIDCGGDHFAGREMLYDVKTLITEEIFDQAEIPPENRPNWSQSSDNFLGEK